MSLLSNRMFQVAVGAGLILAALLTWQFYAEPAVRPHLLSETELRALPDDEIEQRIINDLAQRLAYAGYTPDAWRRLPAPAAQLWAINAVEESISGYGFARIAEVREGAGEPGLQDAIEAYDAMGLSDASAALAAARRMLGGRTTGQSDPTDEAAERGVLESRTALLSSPGLRQVAERFRAAIAAVSVRERRLAFIKEHIAQLVAP